MRKAQQLVLVATLTQGRELLHRREEGNLWTHLLMVVEVLVWLLAQG